MAIYAGGKPLNSITSYINPRTCQRAHPACPSPVAGIADVAGNARPICQAAAVVGLCIHCGWPTSDWHVDAAA